MAMDKDDLAKFEEIKARVRDIRQSHNLAIEKGEFLHFDMAFMKSVEWLCQRLNAEHGIKAQKTKPVPKDEFEGVGV